MQSGGKPLSRLLTFHEKLCQGLFWAGGILLFLGAMTTCYDIFMRYFFNRPTSWSIDFVEYTLIYSTFFGAAWILKEDGHVKMTILTDHLRPRKRAQVEIVNSTIGALACLILCAQGVIETWGAIADRIVIVRPVPVPKWAILWVIPFGLFLFATYFIRNLFTQISRLRTEKRAER
jgi:C4-dicarboxylate transporter, DctQ subunit